MDVVHVCVNFNHLLYSLATCENMSDSNHTVFLPINHVYVEPLIRKFLKENFPAVSFVFVSENVFRDKFICWPKWVPSVIRKKTSWQHGRLIGIRQWSLPKYFEKQYDLAFCYNPRGFLAKVASGSSRKNILRADGCAAYTISRVRSFVSMGYRLLAGLHPVQKTNGEERWIDSIEVEHPDQLPLEVLRKKAVTNYECPIASLQNKEQFIEKIKSIFLANVVLPEHAERKALILTQPLSEDKHCLQSDELDCYNELVELLQKNNFRVFVKQHPREKKVFRNANVDVIKKNFPVEMFSLVGQRFSVAISIHTTALDGRFNLADDELQLLPLGLFTRRFDQGWREVVRQNLQKYLNEVGCKFGE